MALLAMICGLNPRDHVLGWSQWWPAGLSQLWTAACMSVVWSFVKVHTTGKNEEHEDEE